MARGPRPLVALLAGACSAQAVSIWEVGKPQGHIEIIDEIPPPKEFWDKYIMNVDGEYGKLGKPVLFRGAAKEMPAYKLWTDEYLKEKHGDVLLDQVELEKKETRKPLPEENWTVAAFLDEYTNRELYSTAQTPKALGSEVYLLPPMNCGGHIKKLQETVTWISSGGTKSVIHSDGNQNFHCVFSGTKNWIMWPPKPEIRRPEYGWVNVEEEGDAEFEGAYGSFFARIDVDNVDLKRFPAWDKLKWWKLTLNAGDCTYIPASWFHFVQGDPQRSVSVHTWFQAPNKFDQKSCDALEAKGHNTTDFLMTIGDCTWGYPEKRKTTKCKLGRSPALKRAQKEEEL